MHILTPVMSQGGGLATSTTEVTSKSSSNKWFGLAALAVVGLVGWSLTFGSGGGSASKDEVGIEDSEEQVDAQPVETSTTLAQGAEEAEETTNSLEDSIPSESSENDETEADEVEDLPSAVDESELVLLDESGGTAVLKDSFGFAILLSGHGSRMRIYDPNSSRLVELKGVSGEVALLTQTHLVMRSESGVLRSLALNDLDADRIRLNEGVGWIQPLAGPSPNQVWLLDQGYRSEEITPTRTLLDLNNGEVIRSHEIIGPVSVIEGAPGDLVNVRGGGVFEEGADGEFGRFANGWALGATEELVLVRRCAGDLSCQLLWLDRQTGATLDFPPPDLPHFDLWGVVIDASSTWIWVRTPQSGSLIRIEDGQRMELSGIDSWPGPGISPDGRWATYIDQSSGKLEIVDLESGESFHSRQRIPGPGPGEASFVPLSTMVQFLAS